MVRAASRNRYGALHTATTHRAQTLRAIVTHKRSTQRSVQSPSAFARHIRSTPCSVQTLGVFAHQLDGIAAPARTVKAFLLRMPGFWLTLSISGDRLRLFCVKAIPLAMSALRYSLFSHVFIAKCRTQRPSVRKPKHPSAINRALRVFLWVAAEYGAGE